MTTAIVWFRADLRLADNPALEQALERHEQIIPLFIDHDVAAWNPGAASRWWLHHSLKALDDALRARGAELWIRKGDAHEQLRRLARQHDVATVFWNRRYEPAAMDLDRKLEASLQEDGLAVVTDNALLISEPWEIETGSGTPYKVFTPFYKTWRDRPLMPVASAPDSVPGVADPDPLPLDDLSLLPSVGWDEAFYEHWCPGENGAREALELFTSRVADYEVRRDRPATEGTSRLSPHLHFGEIAPWRVADALGSEDGSQAYVRELAWREFSYHLLYHYPHTTDASMNERFEAYPWGNDQDTYDAWKRGQTGIPIVDAGMRELWTTGWMHNRVRMVVASFLTKNLRQHWLRGAQWFWDTLVDADLANNTQGWQWTAGCGADAAPYFRIFNPVLQAEKFDPKSHYIKKWVPELNQLDAKAARAPWQAKAQVLKDAGVELGENYPRPIVDLQESRREALDGYDAVKAAG